MAEIRKHRPRTSAIGDQVRALAGDGPRPVEPGSQPAPTFDPYFEEETTDTDQGAAAAAVTDIGTSGWYSIDPGALSALGPGQPQPAETDED